MQLLFRSKAFFEIFYDKFSEALIGDNVSKVYDCLINLFLEFENILHIQKWWCFTCQLYQSYAFENIGRWKLPSELSLDAFFGEYKLIQINTPFLWSILSFNSLLATLFFLAIIGLLLSPSSYFNLVFPLIFTYTFMGRP